MTRVLPLLLIALSVLAVVMPAVYAGANACELSARPSNWRFVGAGFHMKLAIDYPLVADNVSIEMNLPRSFFIDAAEAEQQYRMIVGATEGEETELTSIYTPLRFASDYFFDIEAPVFKVNYSENHVEMSFAVLASRFGTLKTIIDQHPGHGVLEIPIHARYENLNTDLPFNFSRFVTDDTAYVERCLEGVLVTWRSSVCGEGTTSSSRAAPGHCSSIPVGVLSELPFVYHALMALLVVGAAIVVLSI